VVSTIDRDRAVPAGARDVVRVQLDRCHPIRALVAVSEVRDLA
jgi:hypothetical protein